MLNISVLISGGGTNLQAIIDACEAGLDAKVVGVVSNRENAYGLKRAKKHHIENHYIGRNYTSRKERTEVLIKTLEELNTDLVVLAGYLEILDASFIKAFENKIINIHPSLIPKYAGKGYYGMKVHEAVIRNNELYSGASVHFVDEMVDTGQIIIQESIKVNQDTPETLQKRVLAIEHRILIKSIEKIIHHEI